MSEARLSWISGPVLRARPQGPFAVNEAVLIGEQRLLGEVIRLTETEIVVQVYEDTTGLRPGTPVHGTGRPLAVELGPGLLGNIFDGLLRPLAGMESIHVQPGMWKRAPGLFPFTPKVRPGDELEDGALVGEILPKEAMRQHALLPPGVRGTVTEIRPAESEARAPKMMRLSTSRPTSSVPNQ